MKKFVSICLFSLSAVSIILVMLALQDIFHGREPQHVLNNEWLMVRYGLCVIIIFHVWIGWITFFEREKILDK